MRYELFNLEEKILELLDVYTLEEVLERNDITNEECVSILFHLGYITFPSFLVKEVEDYNEYN